MEKANILVIEDSLIAQETVREHLAGTPHEIVSEAATLDDALAAVDDIARGKLACDVVVLDGDINPSITDLMSKPIGYGGAQVVSRIRKHNLCLKVIGFSANAMSELGIAVDIDLQKSGLSHLAATIASL